ncbi:MAG: hypothetical protein KA741_11495, partial [Klebsiella sp.]|nr:hypothetical protein [Klebsiella sp.]
LKEEIDLAWRLGIH